MGSFHAFLWDGTTMVDLGTLGGSESQGVALNASGQVTGAAETAEGVEHAFLWDGTTMLDLGTLSEFGSQGLAIKRFGAGDGRLLHERRQRGSGPSRLPVGRHDDPGSRHAGGHAEFCPRHQ
jgi:probable HAF family extracellular repeat protein